MTRLSLPAKPSLDHLKRQARDLLKGLRKSDPAALQRATAVKPNESASSPEKSLSVPYRLADAQFVVDREYGFRSWPVLKREVERRTLSPEQRHAHFLRAATHGQLKTAIDLLEDDPALADASVHAACVTGNLTALETAIASDSSLPTARGGPCGKDWTLLHNVCFSHIGQLSDSKSDELHHCAKLLLAKGADPNAAFFHPSWPQSPQRPLYGAAGEINHPALAKALIEAGALLDDGEAIYHACEHHFLDCMELLRDAGLDLSAKHPTWKNTVLYFLLGYNENASHAAGFDLDYIGPKEWDATALHWSAWHGQAEAVSALLELGANPKLKANKPEDSPPLAWAAHGSLHSGNESGDYARIVRELLAAGAEPQEGYLNMATPAVQEALLERLD